MPFMHLMRDFPTRSYPGRQLTVPKKTLPLSAASPVTYPKATSGGLQISAKKSKLFQHFFHFKMPFIGGHQSSRTFNWANNGQVSNTQSYDSNLLSFLRLFFRENSNCSGMYLWLYNWFRSWTDFDSVILKCKNQQQIYFFRRIQNGKTGDQICTDPLHYEVSKCYLYLTQYLYFV